MWSSSSRKKEAVEESTSESGQNVMANHKSTFAPWTLGIFRRAFVLSNWLAPKYRLEAQLTRQIRPGVASTVKLADLCSRLKRDGSRRARLARNRAKSSKPNLALCLSVHCSPNLLTCLAVYRFKSETASYTNARLFRSDPTLLPGHVAWLRYAKNFRVQPRDALPGLCHATRSLKRQSTET